MPSIVYGILGLAFLVRGPIGLGRALLAGALTLSLLVLPIVIIASREAIRAVPPSIREGSLALGATRWQTIWRQVLPAAIPGIATGSILALSRAIGETAPLILIGAIVFVPFNPSSLTDQFTALPIQIFNWTTRPQEEFKLLAAAAILVLLGSAADDERLCHLAEEQVSTQVVKMPTEQMTEPPGTDRPHPCPGARTTPRPTSRPASAAISRWAAPSRSSRSARSASRTTGPRPCATSRWTSGATGSPR